MLLHPTILPNQNKTLVVSSMTIIAHNSFVFYSFISSTHRLGSDATIGEHSNFKKIPTRFTKIHLGVHLATSHEMHLHTFVDRSWKRYINAVDVVVRLHDPTDPSTERTAPPSSAHVQLDDVPPTPI